MNILIFIFGLLVLSIIIWVINTYPKAGHVLYNSVAVVEARMYNLRKKDVQLDDISMCFHQTGQSNKSAILLLHGFSADKNVWTRFGKYLAGDYQLIIPDLAGHGESPFAAGLSYSIEAQAARLIQLLDKLDVHQCHVIGNSMGGFVAAYLAIEYPERILSAALIDPAGTNSALPSKMDEMLKQGRNPFYIDNKAEFAEFYAMTMAEPPYVPGVVLDAIAQDYIAKRQQLQQIFTDFNNSPLLTERLSQLKQSTLLIWGEQDEIIHVTASENWKVMSNIEIEVWSELGHMPMVEDPQRTAERYLRFLGKELLQN
jgi:pimeloyl-ACP methyl ester carboxylesterase